MVALAYWDNFERTDLATDSVDEPQIFSAESKASVLVHVTASFVDTSIEVLS